MTDTVSTNAALLPSTPLIFEYDSRDVSGVEVPARKGVPDRLGGMGRRAPVGLPGVSEPEAVRHYTRLSRLNYSIDAGFYPLGSCTMKYNPRVNEAAARLPGLGDLHPFQPQSTVQGALELMDDLARWLTTLTGMPAVALSPAAGAHGELCGLMCIRAALEAKGEGARSVILAPESAHGTNPATAALCGYKVESLPATEAGLIDLQALKDRLGPDVAAVMVTNPNTCGLFEVDAREVADLAHAAGAFFYMDGANFNAIMGRVSIAALGVDAMHINLHKTFSTPHGGGGPGAGPTVLSDALAPFAPVPFVQKTQDGGFELIERTDGPGSEPSVTPFGRMKGGHGQFGTFVRALAYLLSMGLDGCRSGSGDAVLNANYLLARLKDVMTPAFAGRCMHECLFDDRFLKGTGVSTLDFAKAMIDAGYHPPTMYFPLVVHGALLMEPTESESRQTLDTFIEAVRDLVVKTKEEGAEAAFRAAPVSTPMRRMDEAQAARKPVLVYPQDPVEAGALPTAAE